MQNSLAKELYIVSYTTFETIKETNILSFRNSRSILELESRRLAKMPHRSRVFKTRVLSKKNFTYSGVFNPYSDVLCPYSGVFIQFMKIESLRLDFQLDFFPHYANQFTNRDLKTRFLSWNSSFRHSRC